MRVAWATDIHFDHASHEAIVRFALDLKAAYPDALFITGDISTAGALLHHLDLIAKLKLDTYFVLGNHDFYYAAFDRVRSRLRAFAADHPHMHYLTQRSEPLQLTPSTWLVGDDGWYDFGHGPKALSFVMSDFLYIHDYHRFHRQVLGRQMLDGPGIVELSRELAQQAAERMACTLAACTAPHLYVLTHVPPFAEASRYEGKPSEAEALGCFCSVRMGEVLRLHAQHHPQTRMTVLAGHTHDEYDDLVAPNIRCMVGKADYGTPTFRLLEVP